MPADRVAIVVRKDVVRTARVHVADDVESSGLWVDPEAARSNFVLDCSPTAGGRGRRK